MKAFVINSLIVAGLCFLPYWVIGQCITPLSDDCTTGCTYTIAADVVNPTFNVNSGEKLCVESGVNVTGNWNVSIAVGGTVVSCGNIDVGTISINSGTFFNYGSINTDNLNSGSNGILMNYGDWALVNGLNLNFGFEVYNEGLLEVGGDFNMNNDNFRNAGIVDVDGTWRQNGGDLCLDPGSEIIADELQMNNGTISGSGGCMFFANSSPGNDVNNGSISGSVDICVDGGAPTVNTPPATLASTVTNCDVSGCDGILPIVFSSVRLERQQSSLVIYWDATAPASGQAYYRIEQGQLPSQMSEVGRVWAGGQPGELTRYAFTLGAPLPSGYYRIVEVDADGQSQKSPLLFYSFEDERQEVVKLLANPMPAQQVAWLVAAPDNSTATEVSIFTIDGRTVYSNVLSNGEYAIRLAPGVYLLQSPKGIQRFVVY